MHSILFHVKSKCLPRPSAKTQVFIYLFLIERVHLVHGRSRTSRLKDKLYRINLVGLLPYCVIGLLAIHFRNYEISQSGRCSIGVQRQTSILVIVYDLCINVIFPFLVCLNASFTSLFNSCCRSLVCTRFRMTFLIRLFTNWHGGPSVIPTSILI